MPTTNDSANDQTGSANAPAIRTFQFDGGRIGDIKSSVNMFRGNVNYPLNLITLPGRNGLDLTLTAIYQSNVRNSIDTWNLAQPTGTLGLGWSLPMDTILAETMGSASPADTRYYLFSGGQAYPLVAVSSANGITTFQTQVYQFWEISYQQSNQKWTVVREDGSISTYGDTGSGRNTVQWGIAWNNWIDSSANAGGQQQYAVGWNLSTVATIWGDQITYTYDNVLQNVGSAGQPYTKASYLKQITDVFGRSVVFNYQEKTFDLAQNACEYQDPHKQLTGPNATVPDAYQSRYETRYLDNMQINDTCGNLMYTFQFQYALANYSTTPGSDPTYPYLCKRYLTGIQQVYPDGSALPGTNFRYWGKIDPSTGNPAPNRGALQTITYPDGGTIAYNYEQNQIKSTTEDPNMPLRLQISSPWSGTAATPRVWYGPDYTVVTWLNATGSSLAVTVYRWVGRWVQWQVPHSFDATLDLSTLQVVMGADFFCLTFMNTKYSRQDVYLYRKNQQPFGTWTESVQNTALTSTAATTTVALGDDFVMMCNPNFQNGAYHGWSWNWRTPQWEPILQVPSFAIGNPARLTLTAAANYYLASGFVPNGSTGQGTCYVALFYRDPANPVGNGWQPASNTTNSFTVYASNDGTQSFYLLWSAGSTFATATYATAVQPGQNGGPGTITYEERIFSWDINFHLSSGAPYVRSYTSPTSGSSAVFPILATFVSGSQLGNSGNLLRSIGGFPNNPAAMWVAHDRSGSPSQGQYNFAYGADVAVISNSAGGGTNRLVTFNPNIPSTGGFNEQMLENGAYLPTVSGDFLTVGPYVHYRGSNSAWSRLPILLDSTGNWATTQNRAPQYLLYDDASGSSVHVHYLSNGKIVAKDLLSSPAQRTATPNQSVQPGTILAGPNMFVTFPANATFDTAPLLYLYCVWNDTVVGQIYDLPVASINVSDDGSQPGQYNQCYVYDPLGVTYDPVNSIAQYSKVSLYPQSTQGPSGWSTYYYSNGVATNGQSFYPPGTIYNYNHVLNGLLLRQEAYDATGAIQNATTNYYTVFTTRATSPGGPQAPVAGAWFRPMKRVDVSNSITRTGTIAWDSFSGQQLQTTAADYDSNGQPVTLTTTTTYGYQVPAYAAWMLGAHLYTPSVVTTETSGATTTSVKVQTWKAWPGGQWAASSEARWRGTGSPNYDFANWSSGPPSADWIRTSDIVTRSAAGLITEETVNVDGVHTSVVYDAPLMKSVAEFSNASVSGAEASYYGFEAYEQNPGWSLLPGGGPLTPNIVTTDPHTGEQCLKLPAGTASPSGIQWNCTPTTQNQAYLLTCWVMTASGFQPAAPTGLQVVLTRTNGATIPVAQPFTATQGQWQYFALPIDLVSIRSQHAIPPGEQLRLTLTATNGTAGDLYLDDIRFSPLLSGFTARVYDPSSLNLTAQLGTHGEVMVYGYDTFQRSTALIGPAGSVRMLTSRYLSRQGNADQYVASDPNSTLVVKPRGTGLYDDFSSADLIVNWSAPSTNWTVNTAQRLLQHAATSVADSLTLKVSATYASYGVRLNVLSTTTPAHPITFRVGTAASVSWQPSGQWQMCDGNGAVVASAPQATSPVGEWLLFVMDTCVLFFYQGKQILTHTFSAPVTGAFSLVVTDAVDFQALCAFADPSLVIQYLDGAGRELQKQLYEGPAWIASATVYDPLGRAAVRTKPARRSGTLSGYWATLAGDLNWTGDGTLTGDIATYYASGGGGFSNDQGYPFVRTAYDNSPLSRPVEMSLAGKDLAIDSTIPLSQHKTTRLSYAPNAAYQGLPAGQYFVRTSLDANNNQTREFKNSRGQLIIKDATLTGPGITAGTFALMYFYDPAGNLVQIKLPNAFQPPAGTTAADWMISLQYDFLGRLIQQATPDLGNPSDPSQPKTNQFLYDLAGRRRFYLTPILAAANQIGYSKYDLLGRLVEEGLYAFTWNASTQQTLQNHAEQDPDWPPSPSTWNKRYQYDGNGSDLNALLRLVSTQTKAADQSVLDATESWQYDLVGNILSKTVTAPAFDSNPHTVSYLYNNLGNVSTLTLPSDGGNAGFTYTYNTLGLVSAVGQSAPQTANIVRYTYTADSSIETMVYNTDAPRTRSYTYNSPSWATTILDPQVYQDNVTYLPPAVGQNGYYDGKIADETQVELWRQTSVSTANAYEYDSLGRLVQTGTTVTGSATTTETVTYDANGNIRGVGSNGPAQTWGYYGATDRLQNQTGSSAQDYAYDLNGNITSAAPRSLTLQYDPLTGQARHIAVAGNNPQTLDLAYDSSNQRTVKTTTAGQAKMTRLYLRDGQSNTLAEKTSSGGTNTSTLYVYGPSGMVAMIRNGTLYYIVADRLHSTRVALDHTGNVAAAFNYTPSGTTTQEQGVADLIRYLYTGQEFDSETGLYNYRARLYDTVLHRFYSADPAAQFASPYLYAANNPLLFTDPTGTIIGIDDLIELLIIGAIIGALTGLVSGVVTSVENHWSAGEAIWKTLMYTLIGAATGAILVGAGALAEVTGGAVLGALAVEGAAVGEEGLLATGSSFLVRGAINVGTATGLGAAQGAASAALVGTDPAQGAKEGALVALPSNLAGFVTQEAFGPIARWLTGKGAKAVYQSFDEVTGQPVYTLGPPKLKAAVIEFTKGAIAGAVTSGVTDAILYKDDLSWHDVVRDVMMGAFYGGATSNAIVGYNKIPQTQSMLRRMDYDELL